MVDNVIRDYIKTHLLAPLKQYPTVIQDTLIEIIAQKLQKLYEYTLKFPEIVSPTKNRMDILQAIADQFSFTLRDDADIQEQIDILDNILYVYSKRGSIDTIENMWKYYGGDLPKDVKVNIPSYNLFRYSVSRLSGTHVYPDQGVNRSGVYEIRLTNNHYPIPELREFLLNELVAAGNYLYFSNAVHLDITSSEISNHYKYDVTEDSLISIQMSALRSHQGFTWSGINRLSTRGGKSLWSGSPDIYLELTNMIDLPYIAINTYRTYQDEGVEVSRIPTIGEILYKMLPKNRRDIVHIDYQLYCTPTSGSLDINRNIYNREGELIDSDYPGYFILGKSLLGEVII